MTEIRIHLPREQLMALSRLATSRGEAVRNTASKIISDYITDYQCVPTYKDQVMALRILIRLSICVHIVSGLALLYSVFAGN